MGQFGLSTISGNRIAVFVSGYGSNLQALIDAEKNQKLEGRLVLVVSDNPTAFALERAKVANIRYAIVDPKKCKCRSEFEEKLQEILENYKINWIVLAGFMRLLGEKFVKSYRGRIINVHPSLLPLYPGLHSIKKAYRAREPETGVTVHFVDDGMDTGPIILQESLKIDEKETLEQLETRIHMLEHKLLPKALNGVIKGLWSFEGIKK